MADPLFWLALSFLLVVISLTAVLLVTIPAMRELGRAARSAEKLFDTLGRELPPTLEAIRLTGLEITELTDDVTEGVQSAGQVVQQVNQSLATAQAGAQRLNTGTRSLMAGAKAAWRTLAGDPPAAQEPPAPPAQPRRRDRPQPPLAPPAEPEATHLDIATTEPRETDRSHQLPQLESTSLHRIPKGRLEVAPRAEAPELTPLDSTPGQPNPD